MLHNLPQTWRAGHSDCGVNEDMAFSLEVVVTNNFPMKYQVVLEELDVAEPLVSFVATTIDKSPAFEGRDS